MKKILRMMRIMKKKKKNKENNLTKITSIVKFRINKNPINMILTHIKNYINYQKNFMM